jgi:16S rRNA (cytidine1402-2'-O)-methyltransferase
MRSLNFDGKLPLLYLVATPIGNLDEVSPRTLSIIKEADLIACEDTRVTSKLLNFFSISKPTISLREHNEVSEAENIVLKIKQGTKVVYMSDAGYPCISDPGSKLVKVALENGINVSTISGPNAGLNALVASGIDSDHFYFYGFLSPKDKERKDELKKLATREETIIFYEAPHRIGKTLKDMASILGNRKACLARELTKRHEEYIRMNLEELAQLDSETLIGEMVIIVEGAKLEAKKELSDKELIAIANKFIKAGLSAKDAIRETSKITGVNKNRVYDLIHK